MPRRSSDYEITIPVRIRDDTKAGAKSTNSNVDKMAQQAQRDVEKAAKASETAANKAIREVERAERANISSFQRRIRAVDQMESSSNRFREQTLKVQQRSVEQSERAKLSAFQKRINTVDKLEQNSIRVREQALRQQQISAESLQRQRSSSLQAQWRQEQIAFARSEAAKVKAAQQAAADYEAGQAAMWANVRNIALAALLAIGVGLAGLGVAINRAATMQRLEMGLASVAGSAAEAEKQIARLKEVAKVPGLGFREAIQGSLGLQAVGFSAERAEKALVAFGNAVAFTGGKAELERIMLQITQMASAGKVLTADLRPVIQTAPIAARALKEVFGTISPAEINKQVSSVDEFIDRWVEGLLRLSKAPNASANSFENLSDSWDRFLVSLGKPFLGPITGALSVLAPALESAGTAMGGLLGIVVQYPVPFAAATIAITAFAVAMVFASTSAVPTLIANLGLAVQALIGMAGTLKLVGQVMMGTASLIQGAAATTAVFTLGWGAVILVLGAVVYAMTRQTSAMEKANAVTLDQVESQKEALESAKALASSAKSLESAQIGTVDKSQQLNAILLQLDPNTQAYIRSLTSQADKTAVLNSALEKNVSLQEQALQASLRVTGAGILEQLDELKKTDTTLADIEKRINDRQSQLQSGGLAKWWQGGQETISRSIQELSGGVVEHTKLREDMNKALTENQAKLVANAHALGLNKDQFLQFFQSAGQSKDQLSKLGDMYDTLKPRVKGVNDVLKDQARDLSAIQDELKGLLGLGAAEAEQKILDIVRTARSTAEAKKMAEDAKKQVIATGGGRFGKGEVTLGQVLEQRRALGEVEKAAREVFEPKPVSKSTEDRAAQEREQIASMKDFGADLAEAFKEEFGKTLAMHVGQTDFHAKKLGLDHRAAIDLPGLDLGTQEGQFVKEFAESKGVKAWFAGGPMVRDGRTISTGKHGHLGEFSRGLGKPLRLSDALQKEGLMTTRSLEKQIAEESELAALTKEVERLDKLFGKSPFPGAARPRQPISTSEADVETLAQLPVELERKWTLYYEETGRREKELRDRREDFATEYATSQRNLVTEIGNLELDLSHLRKQATDDQFTEQRRLLDAKQEEVDLTRRITEAQDELANSPLNESLRVQLALIQDINSIRSRDEEALKDYNRAILEMADANVYHAQQADTAVAKFLAGQRSVTEIVADAKIGVMETTFDLMDRGLSKITNKLGIMKSLVHDILSGFLKLALSQFFKGVFLGQTAGGATGGSIFGGGAATGGQGQGGGLAGGMGAAIKNFLTGGGGSTTTSAAMPPSVSGTESPIGKMGGPLDVLKMMSGGSSGTTGKGFGSLFKGMGASLAPALPFLGLGLGMGAGGASRFGSVLGGAGGLLAGGMGMAAILGTTTGVFASGGSLAALTPLLTNPFTAIAAGALILGAILLSRNAAKRKNETAREALSQEVIAALQGMLGEAQAGSLSSSQASLQFEELRGRYFDSISGYDSKTKRIATDWWNKPEHPPQVFWKRIQEAAKEGVLANNNRNRMSPVFAGGGVSHTDQLIKVRPGEGIKYPNTNVVHTVFGRDMGYDSEYMYAPRGTRIINNSDMRTAKPMQSGGIVGSAGNGDLPELHIDSMEIMIDADGMAQIVISSSRFKKAVIHNVKVGKKERKIA